MRWGSDLLGHIDAEETASAKPVYFPIIDDSGFWKVDSMSAVVGDKVINRKGNTAICDTGTTLCLVDSALCQAIYSQIPGAKYYPTYPYSELCLTIV